MGEIPTFVTDADLARFAWYWGFLLPLSIIALFFLMYNRVLEKRTKEQREQQRNLTNLKGRSNGHHKEKVHE